MLNRYIFDSFQTVLQTIVVLWSAISSSMCLMLFRKFDKKKIFLKKNTAKIFTLIGLMWNDVVCEYAKSTIFLDLINRKKLFEPFSRSFSSLQSEE